MRGSQDIGELKEETSVGGIEKVGKSLAETADVLLNEILPDTDWTIQIEIDTVAEEIEIVAYHHDSPTGEFYKLPFSRRKKMIIRLKTPEGK